MINRRNFLKNSFAGLGVAGGLATNFASFNAFAAGAEDYKALICVFLSGGMDSHDTLIPFDQSSYNDYSRIRGRLISGYAGRTRARNNLLELNGDFDGREFAFPPEMQGLQELYNQGDMAIVGNVGPLIEPVTRTTLRNGTGRTPPRIGSHNDSTSIWMASSPEGARTGWGGRFSDIMAASNANMNSSFASVSAAGRAIFVSGENIQPFQVDNNGALGVDHINSNNLLGSSVFADHYNAILRDAGGLADRDVSLYGQDLSQIMNNAIDANNLLDEQLAGPGDPRTAFPNSNLGNQLNIVARMISRRQALGAGRQVFFVQLGGFDTHRNQTETLPEKHQDLSDSMRAFNNAMKELGVDDNVTAFTASDFGRTLQVSGSGTDHGWGGHHMVMGGAVNGGQIVGEVPPAALGHEFDLSRGRLIPQVAVDQYAGSLGRWFGLSDSELIDALPGLNNFDMNALNGLFG